MRALRLPSDSVAQPALVVPVLTAIAGTAALWLRQRRLTTRVERFGGAALETLLGAVDANDPVTGAHVRRVARYALALAHAMGVSEHEAHSVERVALFHDIGKIHEALFDIIHEHTDLTPAERREIVTHPRRGAEVLAPLAPFYPDLAKGVLAHHERWDGRGYPKKLRGRGIPLAARIVTLADTFDAVTHSRRYRDGRGPASAAQIIAAGRGTQFDPELVDLMLFPPVFDQMVAQERSLNRRPRQVHGERRRGRHEDAPDVTFRWRTELRERQAPGLAPQRSH
jgi:putative nucleotidyltransferase with HDIG domain